METQVDLQAWKPYLHVFLRFWSREHSGLVSLTWILAEPGHKTDSVKPALRYMLSEEAQGASDSLGYVPLPESLRQKSLAAVNSL